MLTKASILIIFGLKCIIIKKKVTLQRIQVRKRNCECLCDISKWDSLSNKCIVRLFHSFAKMQEIRNCAFKQLNI